MKSVNMEAKVRRKWLVINKIFTAVVIVTCICIAFATLGFLQKGKITLGIFISLVTVLFQLEDVLTEQIPALVCSISEDQEYMKDFTKYMNLEEVY